MGLKTASPEIWRRIVQWSRRADLPNLCLVCKPLQRAAEARLYESFAPREVNNYLLFCGTIATSNRFGAHVRSFVDNHLFPHAPLTQNQWLTVKAALLKMPSLERLVIFHPADCNAWLLDDALPFQLWEARLGLEWDPLLVNFLIKQKQLRVLQLFDGPSADPGAPGLSPGSLPQLLRLEAPLFVASHVLPFTSSLTHLQIEVDPQATNGLESFLSDLGRHAPMLRALNVMHIPDTMAARCLKLISYSCPNLRHLGDISLPCDTRSEVHRHLMSMRHLRVLELDVSRWFPQPVGMIQRLIITELRAYCPTLEIVSIWCGHNQNTWALEGDHWRNRSERAQRPQFVALGGAHHHHH
ncbi:hypothetical protein CONPUDRAFT_105008 [Coniophora puteana RWD-64-598 SS2]|uniref:F-box domain-containing protein n=1 Tax=Coniophora puteana (strain RWD-64-598) TaxID=741705 RepID=A0A5M3MQX4_CONPW|nr:uncharacterized protein CONPUDRAFT_105008 [Coniophora puteana RWD-64-598 SS2]EIW81583.1 hypothetical protein CONPUDRAFT_105008 [Coniophora puteana RWD-64-598 SS2]